MLQLLDLSPLPFQLELLVQCSCRSRSGPIWVLSVSGEGDSFGESCFMGSCFSSRVKDEIGSKGQFSGREGNGFSGGSNKVSSVSAPHTPRSEGDILQSSNLKSFTFSDLRTATRNFRPDSVIGEGGFGSVFKGWVDEETLAPARSGTGMLIAVKRLNQEGSQGHNEWLAEINFLGQLDHPNLVKLIGYCLEDEHRLLIYEFMPKRSLENHLFRRSTYYQTLSWKLRIKIALGAAKGLEYLHSDEVRVIYRDFKTSNILLDSTLDWPGMAPRAIKATSPQGSWVHLVMLLLSTWPQVPLNSKISSTCDSPLTGIAQILISNSCSLAGEGHLTKKSDIYSFGVVLLEMICGRRALDKNRPSGEHNLVEWARSHLTSKRKILQFFDSRLQGQYTGRGALRAVKLAFRCLSVEPKLRPDINEVVKSLEQLQELEDAAASEDSSPQEIDRKPNNELP
ncbi:hypothetical protein SAY86_005311 [Trapa natans]|uniref:non-specific serine/threonine protein kinase n=1 Tax=Trapa natans TaxID=22666 RepID=A0AAN7KUK3_TRANT|nr:hypothetical protein SAY86_005311 [Trapa natans]